MGNLFAGPKTTQTQNSQTQQTGTNATQQTGVGYTQGENQTISGNQQTATSTPNLPSWYSSFLSSIPGQMQSLAQSYKQNAQSPLYGQQQESAFTNGVNQTAAGNSKALQSRLASQGALNSTRGAVAQTQQDLGKQQQIGDYKAQVPLLNAQYQTSQLQGLGQTIQGMSGFTSPINAYGTTQTSQGQSFSDVLNQLLTGQSATSNGQQSSTSNQQGVATSQTNPNLLGGLAGAGLGLLGGK